jgi:hypothetical protein
MAVMVCFMLELLYHHGKILRYPLLKRLSRPYGSPNVVAKRKILPLIKIKPHLFISKPVTLLTQGTVVQIHNI